MAGLRQQQPMLAGLGLLQLTLSVFLLFPPSEALPGDNKRSSSTSVEVVRGLFSRAILSLGYHKILEIPVGAQNITIRETIKSRNYLALATGSGVSIINGNWAINKPGVYLAAGTRLTYRRPNEVRSRTGESITAPGPITEELHLYVIYQTPGPSVYYEYSLLLPNTHTSPQPETLPDIVSLVETIGPSHNNTSGLSQHYTKSPSHNSTDSLSYTSTDSPSHTDTIPSHNNNESLSNVSIIPSHIYTVSPSHTATVNPSHTDTESPSHTVPVSPSYSDTDSPSYTASPSYSVTDSPSYTASPSYSDTDSPSYTASPSYSDTDSPSYTASPSYSDTDSPSYTVTASPSYSDTDSPSYTVTASPSYSDTDSPSYTASPSYSDTDSPSYTVTASPSYSDTDSPSYTVTASPSYSDTDSPSYTASPSYSDTDSPSYTASPSYSDTDSPSYTASPSYSDTDSPSYTASPSYSDTDSPSYTASPSYSDTDSPSYTASPSYSDTDSPSYTVTASPSNSDTDSPSYTASPSYSDTDSPSYTASPSYSDTDSPSYTASPSFSDTDSPSHTYTVSSSHTYTDSPSYPITASPSYSEIDSPSHTDIVTSSHTITDFSTYPETVSPPYPYTSLFHDYNSGPSYTDTVSPSHTDADSSAYRDTDSPSHTVVPSNKDSIGQNLIGNDILNEQEHTNQVPSHPFVSPDSWSSYIWTSTGHTPCTSTCGTGRRQALWRCTERKTQTTVASDLCGPALPPLNHEEDCNTQPCPAFWDLGEWSECSKRCGPGVQHRQVHCRQVTNNNSNRTVRVVTVGTDLCEDDVAAMPVTSQPCQLKVCSQWQLRSDWSPCSVPCGVGQRSREVVCVGGTGLVEEDQDCNLALKPDHLHNCDMGACARSWYTSLWSQRCSAECGKGKRTRASVCLVDHVTNLRLGGCEGERPQEVTSCDAGPCRQQVEWYAGPWGQCSAECGNGTQTRGVACLLRDEGRLQAVDQSKCFHLPQPISSQPCQLKLCGVQWYMTEWSACSRSCEGGYRVREVRCLADNMAPSNLCDPSLTPESSAECNPQPCVTDASLSCRDQYDNCVVVVQARLCVYPYYRTACCTSCLRVTDKQPYPYLKTHRRRHSNTHLRTPQMTPLQNRDTPL